MDWYPLRLSTPVRTYVSGGRAIPERLGREGLGEGRIAETWEVSDVDGAGAQVLDGPLAGRTLRALTLDQPDALVAPGWRGPHFPLLAKFIDGAGMLPVHLHADDETARRLEGQPHGKTEAWHILDAAPGATALVGVKPGIDRETLRTALLAEDFDAVMRRLPVRAGETIYMPGGTLHSFGPDTLIYEIQQTSDIGQHAMATSMWDGSAVPPEERQRNIAMLLDELDAEIRPEFLPPLRIGIASGVDRCVCCAGPYFALERWRIAAAARLDVTVAKATILTNVGGPAAVAWQGGETRLARATSLLLPAALGAVRLAGPADLLVAYLPDLERDIRMPLTRAGYGPAVIGGLGAP